MQGEHRGDFSRDTFDPLKQYSRVLMQQGRVLLDADWNEQASIHLHYLRALASDLIGPHGGPDNRVRNSDGEVISPPLDFEIREFATQPGNSKNFQIGLGHYYVRGILCDNQAVTDYQALPHADALNSNAGYLVYLDVWERHITPLDNDGIRETALGGPHTATRAQVQWQLRVTSQYWEDEDGSEQLLDIPLTLDGDGAWLAWLNAHWDNLVARWQPTERGRLKAKAQEDTAKLTDPCNVPPEARYRGENQLYRVEIHHGGKPADNNIPTFKWSRDNSAIEFAIEAIAAGDTSTTVTVADLGRDEYSSLREDDWVEIVDDGYILQNMDKPLLQVTAVDRVLATVTLAGKADRPYDKSQHPRLRRWDHRAGDPKSGGLTLREGAAEIKVVGKAMDNWLTLEDGVQIQFQPGGVFRTGDYWLIPARAATGDVEWPGPVGEPASLPPHGVEHVYAPLAIIAVDGNGNVALNLDSRRLWQPLGKPL